MISGTKFNLRKENIFIKKLKYLNFTSFAHNTELRSEQIFLRMLMRIKNLNCLHIFNVEYF